MKIPWVHFPNFAFCLTFLCVQIWRFVKRITAVLARWWLHRCFVWRIFSLLRQFNFNLFNKLWTLKSQCKMSGYFWFCLFLRPRCRRKNEAKYHHSSRWRLYDGTPYALHCPKGELRSREFRWSLWRWRRPTTKMTMGKICVRLIVYVISHRYYLLLIIQMDTAVTAAQSDDGAIPFGFDMSRYLLLLIG